MCYSAQVEAAYKKLGRRYRATVDFDEFVNLYLYHPTGSRPLTPRALDLSFSASDGGPAAVIAESVEQWDKLELHQLEELVFAQRTRLVNAERSLQTKVTKKAQNDVRIASNKIERALAKLSRLKSDKLQPSDSRIFPGSYAPVITGHGQDRIIRPMRYQCRLAGKPASHDVRFPGTYNARRDSLERYWSNTFGHNHAILIVNKFYEHVARHALEQRELAPDEKEESVILEFTPEPAQEMIIACLWSEWKGPEGRLLSFAAITDEPPPEVAAAGHDRCIVQIKPENIDAWLNPDHRNLASCYEILDDRPRPYYEHRLAA
ncbi:MULTISPECIES: SOS response-associated peptidase family protein [Achromobacter]|uniref:Abasic site processing protein n=1 Tax=Achromobacter denitrificans TaxID=32002 RepID=A0ABZ3G094_ACHDE|nr:SOS response-associated peptidase family protein [Achromobacter xylosoxidans]